MKYEAAMSQVAATMGISADKGNKSFVMLSNAAKEAGESTKFSASQAAEALNFLALAGYDAEKSVEALPKVLNLAAAGGMDLAYASDLVTDSMSALGLETSKLEQFTDQMAKTSQKSNTSVAQLGEAILTVGGTAKTLSGGITEMNTVLGLFADNGVKGAEGGTALRNIINSLAGPTDKAASLFKELGIEIEDAATGQMRPMKDIIKDLDSGLNSIGATAGSVARANYLGQMFEKADLKSVNALLGTTSERWDSLSASIESSTGSTAQMAATMQNNLKGVLTTIGSQLEGLGIQFYEKFQVPATVAFEGVSSGLTFLSENLNGILTILTPVTAGFLAFAAVVNIQAAMTASATAINLAKTAMLAAQAVTGTMTVALGANTTAELTRAAAKAAGMTVDATGTIITAAGTVATQAETAALLASTGAISVKTLLVGTLSGTIGIVTAAQMLWNAAMAANPIGLAVAGIAALTAGLVVFTKWIMKGTDTQQALKESTKSLKSENDKLLGSIKDSGKTYEDNAKTIIANAGASELLAQKVFALAQQENKSATEKAKLSILVDQLNASMPELNMLLDEEGNIIGQTSESVYALIEAKKEEAKQQAATERAVELAREQMDIEMRLNEIKTQQAEWDLALEDKTVRKWAYKDATKELAEEEARLQAELLATGNSLDFVTETMVASKDAADEQTEAIEKVSSEYEKAVKKQNTLNAEREQADTEATQQMIINASELGLTLEEYQENLDDAAKAEEEISKRREETITNYTNLALDMFNRIEETSKISLDEMSANMEHNAEAINRYGDNILSLEGKIDQGLLESLKSGTPEAIALTNDLANGTEEQINRFNAAFVKGGEVVSKDFIDKMKLPEFTESGSKAIDDISAKVDENKALETAMTKQVETAQKAAIAKVNDGGFMSVGTQIINGVIKGITTGQSSLNASMVNMANSALRAAKEALVIKSPSQKFEKEIGAMLPAGMAIGIEKGTDEVSKAAATMSKAAYDAGKLKIKDYQNDVNYMVSEEKKMWEALARISKEGSKERIEIEANVKKLQEKAVKEQLSLEKDAFDKSMNWITTKKKLGILSYEEEMAAYERMQQRYAEGSEYREKIDTALHETQKKQIDEQTKMFNTQQDIIDKMVAAEEKYQKAIDDRAAAIMNSFNAFDELKKHEDISSETLFKNLDDQTTAMGKWSTMFQELSDAGINQGLLADLSKMGESATPYLKALTSMSDTELKKYSDLYGEKQAIAREQAITELQGMEKDVVAEIKGLTDDLNKIAGTDFKDAGVATIQGYIDGVRSKFEEVKIAFEEMGTVASDALTGVLQIKSPSRLFKRYGENTDQGFIDGVVGMSGNVKNAINSVFSGFETQGINANVGIPNALLGAIPQSSSGNIKGSGNTFVFSPNVDISQIDDVTKIVQIFKQMAQQEAAWGV